MKRLALLTLLCLACQSQPAAQQVLPDATTPMAAATGGSGTGLAQDATVQQIIKLYGASIPQGGSGTGLCQDASLQALYNLISVSPGLPCTSATVTSGQTYSLLASDCVVRFDTTGGTTATADMHAAAFVGQTVTFYWWAWAAPDAGGPTPPTVNVNAGFAMVPYSGQSMSGAAGLVTTSAITAQGSSYTLRWDGTEWTVP
ncbi:MAG: hypothetical protein ACYDDA_04930 [Acidiferrobacteraceae bacterium]